MPDTLATDLIDARRAKPVLELIANKWAVLILTVLCARPSRFNEILRRLDGLTHKALADALKKLERHGLVVRRVIPSTPVGVEYSLTPLGLSLKEPFAALYAWALANADALAAAGPPVGSPTAGEPGADAGIGPSR